MGNGWGPTVLNDQMKLDFIRQGQRGFTDAKSYWVAGSTNSEPYEYFDFDSYIIGDSGD